MRFRVLTDLYKRQVYELTYKTELPEDSLDTVKPSLESAFESLSSTYVGIANSLKESHGTGPCVRHGGSIGACSSPSRVWKGKRMAGHLGAEQVTVQNLSLIHIYKIC